MDLPFYKKLELEYAKFCGAKYAIAVNSGMASLHLALLALGVGKGDEIIMPDFTFAGCGFAVSYCGATPVFVDCGDDLNIDTSLIEKKITKNTVAILAIHTYGRLANMKEILRIAKKHKLKVIEDACFVAGTKVLTSKGNINIENVEVGDFVMTRKGYKKVLVSSMTGVKKVITKLGITATPDHPFITTKGIKRLDTLCASDTIYKWNEKQLCIEEKNIIDIQNQIDEKKEFITGDTILTKHQKLSIDKYGLITLVKSVKDWWYTIKTKIHSITIFQTLNYSQTPNIANYTAINQNELNSQFEIFLSLLSQRLQNGTEPEKDKNWEEKHLKFFGKINQPFQRYARYVKNNINAIFRLSQDSVQKNAKINQDIVPVYNLTIEDCHEFFANNILVHNCEAQGAVYKSKADITCYSFYENKIIHAEEGGMCTTDNKKYSDRINYLKNMAFEPDNHNYFHAEIGYNYRMPNSQAKLALQSLKDYPEELKRRREKEEHYTEILDRDYRKKEGYKNMPKRDAPWVFDFIGAEVNSSSCRPFFKPLSTFPMYGGKCQSPCAEYYSKIGHYLKL